MKLVLVFVLVLVACSDDDDVRTDVDTATSETATPDSVITEIATPDSATVEDAGDVDTQAHISACPTGTSFDREVICDVALDCVVAEECCCGACFPQETCRCAAGDALACSAITDVCFFTTCSEGCGPNEVRTPLGCGACHGQARTDLQAELATIDAGRDACAVDTDCTFLTTQLTCGDTCDRVVAVSELAAADATVAAIESAWCPEIDRVCGVGAVACPRLEPRCDAGHCVAAAPCDPDFAADGDPCDDDDACTSDDHCHAGACIGAAMVCEDGNICTNDLCVGGTCYFPAKPEAIMCLPEGCSVGGLCQDGECRASDVQGWIRVFTAPAAEHPRWLVPDGEDLFLVAKGSYRTISGQGVVGDVVEAPSLDGVVDLVPHPDGGFALAVFVGTNLSAQRVDRRFVVT